MAQAMRVQELTPEQLADKTLVNAMLNLRLIRDKLIMDGLSHYAAPLGDIWNDLDKARAFLGEPYDMAEDDSND